ncbi:sigma 54-interacting transcriptional regulator [Megalodesulfovibrio gigas]|uniref:Putative Fis family sigma-54 specific transcriptional activator n=1 Tax=Megalodesulfovibrio gigas (strain ATCC 19364 / DSM 1382 / NCIMB 9332 / VKM B-1759) TaxID=1121448 RepID=T2GB17_MEGG1|nr:sigma 54-interacting transcriptional regulator [Megalodesulfovibrio gigas]AGW13326.1 putative Fis family sigma-54 specific transcriptional activator [Megalodesulfovibrio gigas DSM 1382 = ATCC 19364]
MTTLSTEALGRSEAFLEVHERLALAARIDRPVLLAGERGSGKELAAARLHFLSPRWQGPFLTLHCAALSPGVLESELFGHEAGAFTGAVARRKGRFELADGGTLFLDEIAHIPMPMQIKLLRVVESQVFERVGGVQAIRTDVRLVAASNRDLPALAARGEFAPDLLDRLAFEVVTLPPLRARGEDVLLLADHFARRMAVELGRSEPPVFSDHALHQLRAHPWPGNVRELKNVVERAVARTIGQEDGDAIRVLDLDPFDSPWRPVEAQQVATSSTTQPLHADLLRLPLSLPDAVARLERQALHTALAASGNRQGEAARLLGLTYHQFRALYRKHKANPE